MVPGLAGDGGATWPCSLTACDFTLGALPGNVNPRVRSSDYTWAETSGELPKRPKGSDCKSDGVAFVSSNLALATSTTQSRRTFGSPAFLFHYTPYPSEMTDLATPDLSDLLGLARETALTAGALAKQRRAEGVQIAASKSSPEDVVTQADRETERCIRRLLADARPNDGFYGEESEGTTGSSGLTWVVDPIDGTVNYLYGIPLYAVSIAVVEGEADPATRRALAGAVYNPALDELYTAAAGRGAYLGPRRLHANTDVPLGLALAGTGFGYLAKRRQWQADVMRGLIGEVRDVRRLGSAALDLCGVAAGRLDVYFERGLHPWDHAAGALIAREAGAQVGGLGNEREGESLLIAADPGLYARFEPVLAKLFEQHAASAA